MAQNTIKGIGSGSGYAMAPAVIVQRGDLVVPQYTVSELHIETETVRFEAAIKKTRQQLLRVRKAVAKAMGEEAASIIDAQLLVLSDPAIIDETESIIRQTMCNVEHALDEAFRTNIDAMRATQNDFFLERIPDFLDVRRRLLANLLGKSFQIIPPAQHNAILVIDNLAPSETAHLFGSKYVGIITETGGFTSHISIMARTMDIPAVLGVERATELIAPEQTVLVDSMVGQITLDAEDIFAQQFTFHAAQYKKYRDFIMRAAHLDASTSDGFTVHVSANMELVEELPLASHYGAAGIGLFRSELLYIQREDLPSEAEQFEVYQRIATQIAPHTAIIRTFDVGGDKMGRIFEHGYEPNPFLGFRAIRIGLVHPEILRAQLRAILRASAFGKLKIMFPMVTLVEEMISLRGLVTEIMVELGKNGIQHDTSIEIGAMIEVPSAAIIARELAQYCDFFSIGTNDLVQYTLAADRGNPKVANLYQTYHPAVLKLIKFAIDAAHLSGIWCGVCGEMAGKARAVPMLLGMGCDEFSTIPASVPLVKSIIRSTSMSSAREIASEVLRCSTEAQVIATLDDFLVQILPTEISSVKT